MPRFSQFRKTLRFMLGQQRQCWRSGCHLYVELRAECGDDETFLDALEAALDESPAVRWARYVPELERLVIATVDDQADQAVLRIVRQSEQQYDRHQSLFQTHTRFPVESAVLAQSGLEMAADVVGLVLGTVLGRTKGRRSRTWTDFNALITLLDNFPELRRPAEAWLGEDNLKLLLSLTATFSEAMTKGRSGGFLRLALRLQSWNALRARQAAWFELEPLCLELWRQAPPLRGMGRARIAPMPSGPIEEYTQTSEKFVMAGFSVELANTHDLTNATAALFAAVPKPANYGRDAFCIELERRLAKSGVLVLETSCLRVLDRVTRVLVDARLLARTRYSVAAVRLFSAVTDLYDRLDRMVGQSLCSEQDGGFQWRLEQPQGLERLPRGVHDWWQAFDQPVDELRLLWRDDQLIAAALVQEIMDTTVDTVLSRMRRAGVMLTIAGDPSEIPAVCRVHQCLGRDHIDQTVREWQANGDVVLAVGWGAVLAQADIAVGALCDGQGWPQFAHMLTPDPMDTLWRFAIARDQGRRTAEQSVVLSKIEAFSGLILSLNRLDIGTVRRIRQTANIASAIAMANGVRLARGVECLPQEMRIDPTPWHAMDVETALQRLGSGVAGLRQDQINERLSLNGAAEPGPLMHFLDACAAELGGPLVPVLMAGAGLAALTGAVLDAGLIGAVIGINGVVGGVQRYRTERRLRALDRQERRQMLCIRGGQEVWVDSEALVPGDLVLLHAGEVVPADCRLLEGQHLEMDESSLTGESLPVAKSARPSHAPSVAERSSMLYEGTVVAMGEARALVVARRDVSEAQRAHYLQPTAISGVEARLDSLTSLTMPMAAFSGISVMIAGLSRKRPVTEVVGAGVSLAVAAVPEGLPLLSTMVQLAAAGRLAEGGAVARNPRSIEAMGRMTVLCADKTGTLTEGALALRVVALEGGSQAINSLDANGREVLSLGLMASPEGSEGRSLAHLTDDAVLRAARQYNEDLLEETAAWRRIKELPFRSERGYHATLAERAGKRRICVKGAPDLLLPLCDRWKRASGRTTKISDKGREQIFELAHDLAARGYRVLAVAERTARSEVLNEDKVARLVFRGFLAMADPVRATARDAVASLRQAGVAVKIVTGDHPVTALAIARELGLDGDEPILTGQEMEQLDDAALDARVAEIQVFARVTPRHKARIVAALQRNGEVVGMTGDGANDAPAIRLADVGIALGERSTAAARSAADLLVVDGRIETIVAAVLEGRGLWASVRDAVAILVGGNLGEIGFTLLGGLLDGRSPLNARQLLLVNLLTDTLPALAVALRRPEGVTPEQLLQEGPDASLGAALTRDIQWRAGLTGGITTASWLAARTLGSPERASTVALLTLVGSQLGQALVAGRGSREVVLTALGTWSALACIVQIPGVSGMFGCRPLGPIGWSQALTAIGASVLGSRWMPEIQEWTQILADATRQRVREWLAEEEALELLPTPETLDEAAEESLADWWPELPVWMTQGPEMVVQSLWSWLASSESTPEHRSRVADLEETAT